ncbi:hypothetical protein RCL1_008080 [Eukaryota sp. TZLM3-RCL]
MTHPVFSLLTFIKKAGGLTYVSCKKCSQKMSGSGPRFASHFIPEATRHFKVCPQLRSYAESELDSIRTKENVPRLEEVRTTRRGDDEVAPPRKFVPINEAIDAVRMTEYAANCDRALIQFIASTNSSFNVVNNEAFRNLVSVLSRNLYEVPSDTTCKTKLVDNEVQRHQQSLKNI